LKVPYRFDRFARRVRFGLQQKRGTPFVKSGGGRSGWEACRRKRRASSDISSFDSGGQAPVCSRPPFMIRTLFISAFCLLFSALPLHADPKILLSASTVSPGETLRVEVDGVAPNDQIRLGFGKGFFPFFTIGPDAQRALLGIRLDAAPGKYSL